MTNEYIPYHKGHNDKQTQNDLLSCPACKKPAMRLDRHPNLICCTDSKCMCGGYVYDEKMWRDTGKINVIKE